MLMLFSTSFTREWLERNIAGGDDVCTVEISVKGGLILTQLAEGLQISTKDKTGRKKCSCKVSSLVLMFVSSLVSV